MLSVLQMDYSRTLSGDGFKERIEDCSKLVIAHFFRFLSCSCVDSVVHYTVLADTAFVPFPIPYAPVGL